jgi:hypothetical protein
MKKKPFKSTVVKIDEKDFNDLEERIKKFTSREGITIIEADGVILKDSVFRLYKK